MAVTLTIASGKTNVAMPNGGLYKAGDVVVLTDAQYTQIAAANRYGGANALFTAAVAVAAGTDGVTTQGALVTLTSAAPAALTAAASVGVPTKVEFDKVVVDLAALRTPVAALVTDVAAIRTSLTGTAKPLSAT